MSRFNDGNEVLRRLEAAKNGTAGNTGSAANATAGMSDADKQGVAELRKLIAGRHSARSGIGSQTAPVQTAPVQTAPAQTAPAQTAPAQTAPAQTSPAQTSPAQTDSTQSPQNSEQEQQRTDQQNDSFTARVSEILKDKKEKAQATAQATVQPALERGVYFYENSPMGANGTPAAAQIGKGAASLPTSMQNKIVQGGNEVLAEKAESADKAISDTDAARREISSAQRLMSDTIGIYGATKDENGAIVFQTQEGLNRYLSAEQRYNDAVQQYIDSTGASYKAADEFSDAYQVYSDSMKALFQTFRDMPDSKIRGLARLGNVAAQQYLMTYTNRGFVQRPLSYFTENIDAAIADGDLERADELASWMVAQTWSAEDADAAVAYIDKTFNSSNLYSNGAKNVKGFAEAIYIVDLADRSQWETLYNLMNSPEGDKYKEVIKSVYGIDCDSEESKRDNYLGLAEQLRPKIEAYITGDNKYEFDMLSQSAEYYKTQVANNRFVSRAEDEITRASQSATYSAQMDSYMRSQTAYYILNEVSNQLSSEDAGINMSVVNDSNTTKYLIEYLRDACGVDITGINEENYRQVIFAAMEEQSKKARVMGDVLKRAGFDIDVVRQYSELGVQYGYEEIRQKDLQDWSDNAKWYDWIGINLVMIPVKVLMKPFSALEMLSLYGPNSDVSDPNSYVPVVASHSGVDMLQSATAKTIEENTDWEIFGRNVASFLYTTTMSGLESTASALLFGKWSVLFMGASAASSEANNILARGGNRSQAFWGGLAAGGVEIATEYFSVDMFLKNCRTATGFKSFWEKAGEQFFTEGSEEGVGGVLDLIFDATNMGNLSESSQAVKAYMEQGLSYDDARIEVIYDNIIDILESSFSGGLSGAFSSGFSNMVSAYTNAKTINQRIDFYMSNDNVLSLYAKISAGIQDGDSETAQRRKLRNWISETEFGGLTEAELANARLHEQKRFAFETAKTVAKIAAQETEQRAAMVQEANPEAKVLTSNGTQAYLDTGVVTLNVAKDAGEVLDGIVTGEITSDSISNNQIDRLKTMQPFGREAVSSVLGVKVKRASSASAQRAAVREAIRTFEQNNAQKNAETQNVVATAQNQVQQSESALGMEFDAQNSIPVQTQQNAVSGISAPAMQRTATTTGGETVGDAQAVPQTVPQSQASVFPAQENVAPARPMESDMPVMGFDEFRKQYAALNKDYDMEDISSAYAAYDDALRSGKEMLTPSEFAEQYRAGKPKASNKEVAQAYNEYVENNSVDESDFAEDNDADRDADETIAHSMKDNPYGVERNEYSEKLDQKVVSAIDALAKLFHLKVRFGDLGGNNGLYHADTGLIELDISPYHNGANNGFLFSVSHEIGHAVKARIGAKAWTEFSGYAVKAKGGEKAIKAKQDSAAEYSEYAVAREEVVCDFIGELLSEQKTLDTFCESIKGGEIKAETARGIVAAWRKITGILRGKGVKQTDTATAALVQRVQEQFGTDIETAENAVRKMQKALSAAMKAETQNKNAAEVGDVTKRSIKRTKDIPWEEQIGSYLKKDGKIRHSDTLLLDATPKTLVSDGIVDLPLALPLSVLSKAQSGKDIYHSIKNKNIRKLQDGVRNAVLAIDNKDRNSIIFVTNIVQDGMPILVSFQQDEIFDGDRVHKATSIHLQKNVSNILQGLSKKSTVYVQNKNGLDAASGTLINQQRLNANIKFIDDKLSQKQTNVNSLFSESVPRVQSTKAQQEAKYLSLAEKYRNGTATLLEISEMQKMVDEAADAWGSFTNEKGKPIRLYRGTSKWGGFTFSEKGIFTTPSKEIAQGYGHQWYAEPRELHRQYTPDDGTVETLIKNAETVLGLPLREITTEDQRRILKDIGESSSTISDAINDAWTSEAIDILEEIDQNDRFTIEDEPYWVENSLSSALDYILTLSGYSSNIADDVFQYGSDLPGENSISDLANQAENADKYMRPLKDWLSKHRKEIMGTAAEGLYRILSGYDVSDNIIDIKYKLVPAFRSGNLYSVNTGGITSQDTIREQVEQRKNIGAYSLYGKPGDNPLVIDGKGRPFTNVPVDIWEDDGGLGFSTDYISKRANEEGYTSVWIKNIFDTAMNNYSTNVKGDVVIFFDSNSLKSADPVTYDDNGNVIPLSERFNSEKTDIRYSKKDKPAVSAYTERYGTEITSQAQEDRAKSRSDERAQEQMRLNQAGAAVEQSQSRLTEMIEEADSKAEQARQRAMFTPKKKADMDILKMSKHELAARVQELEEKLREANKARRAYELVANKAKKELLRTKGVNVDPTGVFAFVKNLMKKHESPSLANKVIREKTDALLAIFNKAAEISDKVNPEEALTYVYYEAMKFAEDIVDSGVTYDVTSDGFESYMTLYLQYSELLEEIRDTKLLLPRRFAADVSPEFGAWRKMYYGRLNVKLVEDGQGNIDDVYQVLADQYPEFFRDQMLSEPDMLLHIAEVIDKIYASKPDGVKYTDRYTEEELTSMKYNIVASILTEFARVNDNPRVQTKMDKIIERTQKALAMQRQEASEKRARDVAEAAEKAKTEQQVRDTKEMLRETERTAKRIADLHADYKKKIQNLLDTAKRNEHRATMEAALNERDKAERAARKTERETDALIERLNREHFKQIYGLDRRTKTKIANLYRQMDAKVERLKRAALVAAVRNSKNGRDALRVMQEFRNYIGENASDWTDAEIQTQIQTAQEAAKARKKPFKVKNAFKKAAQRVYFETISDTNVLERFSRLQNRADNLDTMITLYRNSGANVETILTNHLIDPYGNVIDNRSLADVALMMKRGKAGRMVVDEDAQELLNLYMYHKHGVDRMTIRDRAAKSLQEFITAHPEYAGNTPGSLSMTEILLRAKEGDETAQEYIDLCKQFSKAKDKPVFGDKKGRPISAEMHRRIAADIEANHPEIVEKANEIYAWWDKFMQTWWVGTLGTEAQYKAMREMYPHYVPTFRVMEKGGAKNGYRNKTDVGQPIKAAKGSTRNLQPFEDGLASYVQSIISGYRLEGLFDNIANEIILGGEEADRFGEFVRAWDGFKDGKNGTGIDWNAYMEADTEKTAEEMSKTQFVQKEDAVEWHGYLNGKPFAIEISPEMYRSIQSLTRTDDVYKVFGWFKKTGQRVSAPMKAATTGASATFATRNLPKDFQTALINSKVGFRIIPHYFKAFSQMFGSKFGEFAVAAGKLNRKEKNGKQITENDVEQISALIEYGMRRMEKNARWQLFKDMGGKSSNYYRSDIGFVTNVNGDNRVIKGAKKIGAILSAIGEFTESLTRFAEFDAVLDKYGDTPENRVVAIKASAEVTVDFARHGRTGQYLSAWTPYLNAQIQGIDKFFREVKARKGLVEKLHVLKRGAIVGILSPESIALMIVCGVFGDDKDDEYRELDQRMRDTYILIPKKGGGFIKIPKERQYTQLFGNAVERIILWASDGDPDSELSDYFSDYVETSLIPNFVPSIPFVDGIISGTLLDIRNNKDFAGRYIMPPIYYDGSKSHLPEYMKYDETCSWLSIKLGELFNVSPYYIDYFIEDNFADYGTMFIEATNGVGGDFDPIDMLESIYVADPAFSSQTVSDYYDMLDEIAEKNAIAKETMSKEDYDNSFEKKVNSAISNYFGDDIAELNKKVKETTDEDEQRILKLQIREIAENALDFYDRCMSGEIEEPVLYLKYEPYGDAVRNELIRLDGFTKGDDKYSFLPNDDAPNLKGHTNSEEEKTAYTDIYQRNYSKVFGDLICQSKYQNATDAEKADMLEEAREIVYFRSKQEWAMEYGISTDSYDPTEATNKYDTLMDAGISFFDVYAIDNKRKEIDAMEDVKLSVKESEFKTWLSKQPFTAEQKRIVQEEFGEWRASQPVDTENYDALVALPGWSNDEANAVYHTLGALQPANGAGSVSDWQKREAIVGMSLSNGKRYDALRVIEKSNGSALSMMNAAEKAGISAKNFVTIWKGLAKAEGHDLDGNGETDINSLKNARAEMIRDAWYLTDAQRNVVWRWYYKTGDEDGWKYTYKEGKG